LPLSSLRWPVWRGGKGAERSVDAVSLFDNTSGY
jgi:hypothetical protein